jgi:hypothetical protein
MLSHFGIRDRLRHLPRLRLEEIRQHEHGAVEQAHEETHNRQKSDESRHDRLQAGFAPIELPFFARIVKDAM